MSLPSRERGLKCGYMRLLERLKVAPFAGAWIEIVLNGLTKITNIVAPFAGAWIEISVKEVIPVPRSRRSLRGSVD